MMRPPASYFFFGATANSSVTALRLITVALKYVTG